MSGSNNVRTAFQDAVEKVMKDYERGTVNRADLDRLKIWGEFLKTKVEAEREINAKDITCLDDE